MTLEEAIERMDLLCIDLPEHSKALCLINESLARVSALLAENRRLVEANEELEKKVRDQKAAIRLLIIG